MRVRENRESMSVRFVCVRVVCVLCACCVLWMSE